LTANFKGKSVLQPVGPVEKICFLTPFDDRKRWLFSKVFIMPKLQMNDVNVGEHQK